LSKARGLALAEVLVSSGVLLLMLGLVTMALLGYLRGTHSLYAQPVPAEGAARALDRCCRLLRSTEAVLEPSRASLEAGYQPGLPDRPPLLLRVRLPEGFQVAGLTWDPARQCLVQLVYDDPPDPRRPRRRLELGPAAGLTVQLRDETLCVQLNAGSQQLPWSTALDWKGVFH